MDGFPSRSLAPIFRSETQFRLLGTLYTDPAIELSIGQLAESAGASQAAVSTEVARLEDLGLVHTRTEGRRRLVRAATDTTVYAPLRDLLARCFGVPAVLGDEFAGLDAEVRVFGSWAARWHGDPGPPPRDVDVLVVGDVDPTDAYAAAGRASRRLGIEVNVVVREPSEWALEDTGFAREVRATPSLLIETDARPERDEGAAP